MMRLRAVAVMCLMVACRPQCGAIDEADGGFVVDPDGSVADAGAPDASVVDDAGLPDAGGRDAGVLDAGLDAAVDDGGVAASDAGFVPTPLFEVPFAERVAFLSRLQSPDAGFDDRRIAVVRGDVLSKAGAPVPGAQVRCLSHPEWGSVTTDSLGHFDFVVNGGGELTFEVSAPGHLPVQRRKEVRWNDFTWLPDMVLTPVDARATSALFGPASTQMQVLQGSPVTDDAGTRTANVLVPAGTSAFRVTASGQRTPLSAGTFRATEYTVGPTGLAAMPGELPPTSGYTYAVELSLDEVGSSETVEFDKPLALYVDEYLGIPVGSVVPTGFYDRLEGRWKPSDNGRVVQVMSVQGGMATLDLNGDGQAESMGALLVAGIDQDELTRVAQRWPAGKRLTRAPIRHFTPWDCNFPFAPVDFSFPPLGPAPLRQNGSRNPSCQAGSVISCERQSLGERIRLTGVPFDLTYDSERVPFRSPTRHLRWCFPSTSRSNSRSRVNGTASFDRSPPTAHSSSRGTVVMALGVPSPARR
jgi:hypothetical protein